MKRHLTAFKSLHRFLRRQCQRQQPIGGFCCSLPEILHVQHGNKPHFVISIRGAMQRAVPLSPSALLAQAGFSWLFRTASIIQWVCWTLRTVYSCFPLSAMVRCIFRTRQNP